MNDIKRETGISNKNQGNHQENTEVVWHVVHKYNTGFVKHSYKDFTNRRPKGWQPKWIGWPNKTHTHTP